MTGPTWASAIGYWALGVVALCLGVSIGSRVILTAGNYLHDASEEMQRHFGRIVFGTFLIALLYLMVWGCYMLGERMTAFAGSFF